MQEDLLYWIALMRVEGIGPRYAHRLIERFGSPEAVYHASLDRVGSVRAAGSIGAGALPAGRS